MRTDQGEDVVLELPKVVAMTDGDGLLLEDGRWLKILAAPEPVVEIRHQHPSQLARLAWHLGNRHLPTEIATNVLRIRPDHVIETLLRGFGAILVHVEVPFQPEGGAYSGQNQRGHQYGMGGHRHG
jgi:urease accessory protein